MTKLTAAVLTAWLAILSATAATAQESSFPDIQRIFDNGKLRVAILAEDAPPTIMTDEKGKLIGVEANIARDIGKKLGVPVEFVRTADTYDGVVDVVANDNADIAVSFLSSGVERAKFVLFSRPYVKQSGRVFYNRAAFAKLRRDFEIDTLKQIGDTEAVSALKIGVLEGSVYQTILERDFSQYQLQPFDSLPEMMTAVRKGEIFAGVHGELQINHYMHQHPATAIYVAVDPEVRQPSDISIALRPDAPNLLRWINVYLSDHVGLLDNDEIVEHSLEAQEKSE